MFNYSIKPKITKSFLLSHNNEETYMSHYLGIPVKKGLFRSPLRSDAHNTCSFFRGKNGNLYFHDFATGQCLTFEGIVMYKYNCNYYEALNIIARDFGFIESNNLISEPKIVKQQPIFKEEKQTQIQIEMKEFSQQELRWWNSFGVTKDILDKFKIYSCKSVFLNNKLFAQSLQHFPIYGYYFGKKEDFEQWRIYMPTSKTTRFIGNVPTKTVQGYKQLPKTGKLLVITKSMKDVMCFDSLGISAIAPNSETQFVSDKMLDELRQRFKYIALLFDNDSTGVSFTNKLRKKYPDLVITLIPRSSGSKDISDYYRDHGRDATEKLIQTAILKYKYDKIGGKNKGSQNRSI